MDTATYEYALLNLAVEVGELLSLEAKLLRDGGEPNRDAVKKELGDVLWHVAIIATDWGYTLDSIATGNIDKLESRQQRGVLTGSGDNR